MNIFVKAAAHLLLAFLQGTIKNPKTIDRESKVLREIRDAINLILPE